MQIHYLAVNGMMRILDCRLAAGIVPLSRQQRMQHILHQLEGVTDGETIVDAVADTTYM